MIIAAIVQALIATGGTTAQVEAVVKAAEAAIQAELEAPAIRKRDLARERKRAQRAREAEAKIVTQKRVTSRDTNTPLYDESPSNVTHVTVTGVTQKGSPPPPPEDTQKPPSPYPSQNPSSATPSGSSASPKKPSGKKAKTNGKATRRCPAKWQPSEHVLEVAEIEGFTAEQRDREFTKIRDHEFGTPRKDWDAVACNWLRRAAEGGLASGHGPPNGRPLTAAERAQAEEQEGLRRFREREASREKASVVTH